ncbi:MAG TPA: phosphoserine phosphatase SerB [Rhizomicrobium sp.]|nr:phosphoserine phosphatase SerB [Rhizomicrobium sp.]
MTDSLVINVIAARPGTAIAGIVRRIQREFKNSGDVGETVWLSVDRACDIPFTSHSPELRDLLAQTFVRVSDGIDINLLDAGNRRKKLLVADMDSTIIGCECLDELADLAGLKPQISAITERAMRGEIAFEPALRERVAMLKGLALDALERTYETRVKLNPGAKALVATMKKHGARTCLVSGGFTYFTERVAKAAGFDDNQANVLLDDGQRLTGAVKEPILGREAKLAALKSEIAKLNIAPADALAVGDGANDLAMIQHAGLGVAYHAKPVVAEAASASIQFGDLRALLYLQGYSDEEIVER